MSERDTRRNGEAETQRDSSEKKIRERWRGREGDKIRQRKTVQREKKGRKEREKAREAGKQPTVIWGGWR